jgi:type I restriction-modification system DNA methylase subunit
MYASTAGKSGGSSTPPEVSELLAHIAAAGKRETQGYDPACGSGSLLHHFHKVLGPDRYAGLLRPGIN